MPEVIDPDPEKLAQAGVKDMVDFRWPDERYRRRNHRAACGSGGGCGRAAGPGADRGSYLDVEGRTLSLLISDQEMQTRRRAVQNLLRRTAGI